MMAMGFAEILVLALISGGLNSTDLVEVIQPTHYFKSRQVQPTINLMIDYALTEPKTPRDQVKQLLALRYLADESDAFKKAKNYTTNRMAIEEIAQGKSAQDAQGFAKEYAIRLLAKVAGEKQPERKPQSLRAHAFEWFPSDLKMAYAIDARSTPERQGAGKVNDTLQELLKLLPEQAKAQLYEHVEKVGNIRIERIVVGMVDAANRDDQKLIVRLTGKANPDWLASTIQAFNPLGNFQTREIKAADGVRVKLMQDRDRAPIVMMVGDTDLLIVGYFRDDGKHDDIVKDVLDVRAKKKPSAANGGLKNLIARLPEDATLAIVGDWPEAAKRDLGMVFDPIPAKMVAHARRTRLGLEVKLEATQASEEDADKLVRKAMELRKQGVAGLKELMKMPLPPGAPAVPFAGVIDLLEGMQVQGQKQEVRLNLLVPNSLIQQLGAAAMSLGARQELKAPPQQ